VRGAFYFMHCAGLEYQKPSFRATLRAARTLSDLHVAMATRMCCNGNMRATNNPILDAIHQRRAVRAFDPVEIPDATREEILHAASLAPSSFNIQPYRFYWIQTPDARKRAARLCFGQSPAETASALIVAVADIGSWKSTNESQLKWVRTAGFTAEKIAEYELKARLGKWFFLQGWLGIFGAIKWAILRMIHPWKIVGIAPVGRQGMFKWSIKSVALACQNLMIAAEALGLHTCPMEGFDDIRLSKLLGLRREIHQIVMVIAIGKKSATHRDYPQWRRPLEDTVKIL
jgi:nitroreductase